MEQVNLTAEERHQLMAVLREMDGVAPAEKRRTPRRKVDFGLWIRPVSKTQAGMLKAVLVNVAAKGVAIVVGRPLQKGDRFVMPLTFREGGGWLVLCEVRNSTSQGGGAWKIGARFVERIDDPDGTGKPPMDWLM